MSECSDILLLILVSVRQIFAGRLRTRIWPLTKLPSPCLIRLCDHSTIFYSSVSDSITYWIRYVISYM